MFTHFTKSQMLTYKHVISISNDYTMLKAINQIESSIFYCTHLSQAVCTLYVCGAWKNLYKHYKAVKQLSV
jgi:hypothetical protein